MVQSLRMVIDDLAIVEMCSPTRHTTSSSKFASIAEQTTLFKLSRNQQQGSSSRGLTSLDRKYLLATAAASRISTTCLRLYRLFYTPNNNHMLPRDSNPKIFFNRTCKQLIYYRANCTSSRGIALIKNSGCGVKRQQIHPVCLKPPVCTLLYQRPEGQGQCQLELDIGCALVGATRSEKPFNQNVRSLCN